MVNDGLIFLELSQAMAMELGRLRRPDDDDPEPVAERLTNSASAAAAATVVDPSEKPRRYASSTSSLSSPPESRRLCDDQSSLQWPLVTSPWPDMDLERTTFDVVEGGGGGGGGDGRRWECSGKPSVRQSAKPPSSSAADLAVVVDTTFCWVGTPSAADVFPKRRAAMDR